MRDMLKSLVLLILGGMPLFQVAPTAPGATVGGGGGGVSGSLTATRVPFASGASALTDDADMTFATDTLTVTKIGATTFTGTDTHNQASVYPASNAPAIVFSGDTTTGWGWRSSGILSAFTGAGERLRISGTVMAAQGVSLDEVATDGVSRISSNMSTPTALTLNTGAVTTATGNIIPANSIIDAILIRVNTTITTAANFTVKPTGGNVFVQIGTATSSNTVLTAGTTYVLVSAAHADQYNASANSVTITTNANPGAGVLRIVVVSRTLTPPSS